MANTILEKLQEKYPDAEGINDARNIAEAVACINGEGGRGANAIADQFPLTEALVTVLSETITTVSESYGNNAVFSYGGAIDYDAIEVTFNGTKYACDLITFSESPGVYYYGGYSKDFSVYPFLIISGGNDIGSYNNTLYTKEPGTYTIEITAHRA